MQQSKFSSLSPNAARALTNDIVLPPSDELSLAKLKRLRDKSKFEKARFGQKLYPIQK